MKCDTCAPDLLDDPTAQPLNVPLLMETLQIVRTEGQKPWRERLWRQADFERTNSCGTSRCFGGWAIALSGYEVFGPESGSAGGPAEHAEKLLGLTPLEADHLFFCTVDETVTSEEIDDIVTEILERRGLVVPLPDPSHAPEVTA